MTKTMQRTLLTLCLMAAAILASCAKGTASTTPAAEASPEQAEAPAAQASDSSPVPMVIDFWAQWCGPCRQFSPIFHAVEREYKGQPVSFISINVDENPDVAAGFGVRSIPTVVVLDADGNVTGRHTGLMQADEFRQFLKTTLDL